MTVNVFSSIPQNAMSLRSPTDTNSQSQDSDGVKEHQCGASEATQSQSVNAAGDQQSDQQGGGSGQQAFNNSGFKALTSISQAANESSVEANSQISVLSNKAVASMQSFSFAMTSSASGVQMSFSAQFARIDVGGFLSVMNSNSTASTINGIDQHFGQMVNALAANNNGGSSSVSGSSDNTAVEQSNNGGNTSTESAMQTVASSLQGIIKLLGQLLSLALQQQGGNSSNALSNLGSAFSQGLMSGFNASSANTSSNQGIPHDCDQIVELLQNLAKVLNQVSNSSPGVGTTGDAAAQGGTDTTGEVDSTPGQEVTDDVATTEDSNTADETTESSHDAECTDSSSAATDGDGNNQEVVEVNHGRVWGDPHFVGADNGKYDVHGEAGKTYNILSDEGVQLNATFAGRGNGITVMSDAGLTLDGDQIHFDKDGKLSINGEQVADGDDSGTYLDGKITKEKGKISIKAGEYDIDMTAVGQRLDFDFSSPNANADGVLPHGLWGQSVDGDGEARTGDKGKSAQGGGAIEGEDGLTQSGDKAAVEMYETDGLFDTNFENFNRYHAQGGNGMTEVSGDNNVDASNRAIDIMSSIKMTSDVTTISDSELQATTASLRLALEASFSTQSGGDNH